MVKITQALAALGFVASTTAVDIIVQSSGGNLTGKFGHPYGYGFLHEVRFHKAMRGNASLTLSRTSTTLAMEVSMPSWFRTVLSNTALRSQCQLHTTSPSTAPISASSS